MSRPTCNHRTPECWEWVGVENAYTGETEQELQQTGLQSTNVDIDIARFRCTLCGEVGYYTGTWKRFFEEGIPCFGSEGLTR